MSDDNYSGGIDWSAVDFALPEVIENTKTDDNKESEQLQQQQSQNQLQQMSQPQNIYQQQQVDEPQQQQPQQGASTQYPQDSSSHSNNHYEQFNVQQRQQQQQQQQQNQCQLPQSPSRNEFHLKQQVRKSFPNLIFVESLKPSCFDSAPLITYSFDA